MQLVVRTPFSSKTSPVSWNYLSFLRISCNHHQKISTHRESKDQPSDNQNLQISAQNFLESIENLYSYNFSWMGLPIIQYPQDLIALQEIIYETKPTLIIETGFARGGSALFFMSMLHMANNFNKQSFKLVSLDIAFNKEALKSVESSKFADNFYHLEASSTRRSKRFCKFARGP